MSSTSSSCGACKFLRQKCTPECIFAPYFPPDNPQKFSNIHQVFGARNVIKLLNQLSPSQREDCVNSLAYEAEYWLLDPVYGCVGFIAVLQHKLKQVYLDLDSAKMELSTYTGPSEMFPAPNFMSQHQNYEPYQMMSYNMQPMMGLANGVPHSETCATLDHQYQQQLLEPHQFVVMAIAKKQYMLTSVEQQQNNLVLFDHELDYSDVLNLVHRLK